MELCSVVQARRRRREHRRKRSSLSWSSVSARRYAQHFPTASGSGVYHERNASNACVASVAGGGYADLERAAFEKSRAGVPRVATFDLYRGRGDLHRGRKEDGALDCTHYCYAPHVVGPTFDRIATALLASRGRRGAE